MENNNTWTAIFIKEKFKKYLASYDNISDSNINWLNEILKNPAKAEKYLYIRSLIILYHLSEDNNLNDSNKKDIDRIIKELYHVFSNDNELFCKFDEEVLNTIFSKTPIEYKNNINEDIFITFKNILKDSINQLSIKTNTEDINIDFINMIDEKIIIFIEEIKKWINPKVLKQIEITKEKASKNI